MVVHDPTAKFHMRGKLADLGTAALVRVEVPRAGTPTCIPPEANRDRIITDPSQDVWALGKLVAEMAVNQSLHMIPDYLDRTNRSGLNVEVAGSITVQLGNAVTELDVADQLDYYWCAFTKVYKLLLRCLVM